jgi:hypothetical protein
VVVELMEFLLRDVDEKGEGEILALDAFMTELKEALQRSSFS